MSVSRPASGEIVSIEDGEPRPEILRTVTGPCEGSTDKISRLCESLTDFLLDGLFIGAIGIRIFAIGPSPGNLAIPRDGRKVEFSPEGARPGGRARLPRREIAIRREHEVSPSQEIAARREREVSPSKRSRPGEGAKSSRVKGSRPEASAKLPRDEGSRPEASRSLPERKDRGPEKSRSLLEWKDRNPERSGSLPEQKGGDLKRSGSLRGRLATIQAARVTLASARVRSSSCRETSASLWLR
jgi:hypothetical protein